MGAAKRKAVKPSKVVPISVPVPPPTVVVVDPAASLIPLPLPAVFVASNDSLVEACARFTSVAQKGWPVSVPFPQAMLKVGKILDTMHKLAKKTYELFEVLALAHRKAGGAFESGEIVATFPISAKCSPKWKDEATRLGRECFLLREKLAGLTNQSFTESWDDELFVKTIQSHYPASNSTSLKLTACGDNSGASEMVAG